MDPESTDPAARPVPGIEYTVEYTATQGGNNTESDGLAFVLTSLQKTYNLVSQRTQYLDGRATTFLSLLGLAGTGVAAFTAVVMTTGGATGAVTGGATGAVTGGATGAVTGGAIGAVADLLATYKPIVLILFSLTLCAYVAAAFFIAWASRIRSMRAPTLFDTDSRPFEPQDPPADYPKKADLHRMQGTLITATWNAIKEVNDDVNQRKHKSLTVGLGLVVAAIFFASSLSAVVTFAIVLPRSPTWRICLVYAVVIIFCLIGVVVSGSIVCEGRPRPKCLVNIFKKMAGDIFS